MIRLFLLALALLVVAVDHAVASPAEPPRSGPLGTQLQLINGYREAHALPPLRADRRLTLLAHRIARQVALSGDLRYRDRLGRLGYRGVRGELYAAADKPFRLWVRSSARRWLLEPRFRSIGVQRTCNRGRWYWAVTLGG